MFVLSLFFICDNFHHTLSWLNSCALESFRTNPCLLCVVYRLLVCQETVKGCCLFFFFKLVFLILYQSSLDTERSRSCRFGGFLGFFFFYIEKILKLCMFHLNRDIQYSAKFVTFFLPAV